MSTQASSMSDEQHCALGGRRQCCALVLKARMDVCCVKGCNSVNKDKDIFYFEFPLSRTLRRKWLDVIKIGSKVPLGTLICSEHFDINDYETVRGKVRLKKKVVPSILVNDENVTNKFIKNEESLTSENDKEILEKPKDVLDEEDGSRSPNLNEIRRELLKERTESENSLVPATFSERVLDKDTKSIENDESCKSLQKRNKKRMVKDREEEIERVNKNIPMLNDMTPITTDPKQPADFEEMITNYQIKIDKPHALRSDEMEVDRLRECERDSTIVVDGTGDLAPVFIEIPAGKGSNIKSTNQDCLMVLESVQVEVDPSTVMLPEIEPEKEIDSDVEINMPVNKVDPISLLTSSDESDVIIQEPKIDIVEVSDETDEDDMPLVKLVNRKPLKKRPIRQIKTPTPMCVEKLNTKLSRDYFFCTLCKFNATDKELFSIHLDEHKDDLYICSVCSFASYNKKQFLRHLSKHKKEKKYICHICGNRLGHEVSLMYHIESHDSSDIESVAKSYQCDEQSYKCVNEGYKGVNEGYKCVKKGYKCVKCGYRSDYKGDVVKHLKNCNSHKKHKCKLCDYTTKRRSDLKRHFSTIHNDIVEISTEDSCKSSGWD